MTEENTVYFTRSDLVSSYLGETEIKTMKVLEENRGKSIHIDLAYNGEKDLYASQSLNVINEFKCANPDTNVTVSGDVIDVMIREMKEICSRNSLQDVTTPEEVEQCRVMVTNSLQKHQEFAHCLNVDELTHNYKEQYETLTRKLTPEEKNSFTFEAYESIVQATRNILTHIKNS